MPDWDEVHKIAPEYWRSSQLSLARFYGAIKIGGYTYKLDPKTDWLIREDVWKREQKEAKQAAAEQRRTAKLKNLNDQQQLF
jgi:hypothetical protein